MKIHRSGLTGLFSFIFLANSALASNGSFVDVPQEAWFSKYIQDATTLGIVSGYKDTTGKLTGYFGPNDSVLVSEAVKMEVTSVGIDVNQYKVSPTPTGPLSAAATAWWYKYYLIGKGQNLNITSCSFRDMANFGPDRPIYRWEMARLVADTYNLLAKADEKALSNPYSDLEVKVVLQGDAIKSPVTDSPVEWSKMDFLADEQKNRLSVLQLTQDGILMGYKGENTDKPRFELFNILSRAEAVKILLEAKAKYASSQVVKPATMDLKNETPEPCTA